MYVSQLLSRNKESCQSLRSDLTVRFIIGGNDDSQSWVATAEILTHRMKTHISSFTFHTRTHANRLMSLDVSTGRQGNGSFSHIRLGQPAARYHGNREPVEGVKRVTGVRVKCFRVAVFVDLVPRQKYECVCVCVCVLRMCFHVCLTCSDVLVLLFVSACLFKCLCGREKEAAGEV